MKINILLLSVAVGAMFVAGCSKDYMNTEPTSSTGTATIFSTTKDAQLAVNGLARLMTKQYLSSQGFNGEGTVKMYNGNYPGNHFTVNLPGWSAIINSTYLTNLTSIYDYYPWYYYYRIIGNANTIIMNIDAASGPETEKKYIKAQALSYRAYSFMMLAQLYCVRWSDSSNGAEKGLVLRIDESNDEQARATLGETYAQIYGDLNQAMTLFDESGIHRSSDLSKAHYVMDKEVAQAIYARAALNRQDYAVALDMAAKARANYPIMSVADYKTGFNTPTPEWIWGVWGSSDETLYFYSYFAYIGYNADASAVRSYPKCISKELFDKIPAADIRKSLFLDPAGGGTYTATTGMYAASSPYAAATRVKYGLTSTWSIYAYMQFKIASASQPGVGNLNIFRSSEMLLIEAEANYFLNKAGDAQAALVALNATSQRDPGYTTSNTGQALLDEIKMYRALELWGEGFDWFDLKRWGDPIARKSFANGGSFIADLAVNYGPNDAGKNKWTWYIPAREMDYNKLAE